mmetsp:Transcript_40050/g.100570  ORF Transcript_40050/g.100570 Transcript_40050/m.100570 type:complete len:253 (+) Transcript_40050:257-1015(+)
MGAEALRDLVVVVVVDRATAAASAAAAPLAEASAARRRTEAAMSTPSVCSSASSCSRIARNLESNCSINAASGPAATALHGSSQPPLPLPSSAAPAAMGVAASAMKPGSPANSTHSPQRQPRTKLPGALTASCSAVELVDCRTAAGCPAGATRHHAATPSAPTMLVLALEGSFTGHEKSFGIVNVGGSFCCVLPVAMVNRSATAPPGPVSIRIDTPRFNAPRMRFSTSLVFMPTNLRKSTTSFTVAPLEPLS